ncbi:M15 family metallopeptidase [Legionella parisiensis]|uniref:D-alanyl-D-alanine dipeptidase n=1 Tax=Legionella parisiensis TaxID=45071 RepID=A0A1E5JRA8_9GAMM|nr:M15 family metallopeptidase [Legionella parisiensis]KTD44794.1 D-alanyl-D-alanine dipeptidase [Legionella parisiensis]OEH47052.1 D-alanyl-D-alanine dipeptidase [Legionella parisiensis]STX71777.1 D-alanyl-D-alanine dipeptidase [Legionella parisiensis]
MPDYIELDPILLIADPKIVTIPVIDNHEPMIDLVGLQEISYGPSPEIPNNTDYTKMRQSVYEKLKQAQLLLPKGLRFCLYESYRSLTLQKSLFDIRYEKVKNKHPGWSPEQIFTETTRMVSPVINQDGSPNIPPHSTGAAIDVYLIDEQGEAIEMGIHPKDWMQDLDGSLSLSDSEIITEEAKKNRKIMSHVLEAVGFINYRNEYWHWSYGDRYWAYYKQKPYAFYDSCK